MVDETLEALREKILTPKRLEDNPNMNLHKLKEAFESLKRIYIAYGNEYFLNAVLMIMAMDLKDEATEEDINKLFAHYADVVKANKKEYMMRKISNQIGQGS